MDLVPNFRHIIHVLWVTVRVLQSVPWVRYVETLRRPGQVVTADCTSPFSPPALWVPVR